MAFNVEQIRSQFPSLNTGVAHFDSPGGTQTPVSVGKAIYDTITGPLSNRATGSHSEKNAEQSVINARAAAGDLLNIDPRGIVFGRSMTQLTFDFARTLSQSWKPGDEIVVSRLDHDGNVRPWVTYANKTGATLRWIDFDPNTGHLDVSDVEAVITEKTKVVALTAASNVLGSKPDLPTISKIVHSVGALLYVDGVANTAHNPVDMETLGADFYGCSPYKFFGPHIAFLGAKPELLETLHPDKLRPSTEIVPERFELGTLPYEFLAGITAAIDFMANMDPEATGSRRQRLLTSLAASGAHEMALDHQLRAGLESMGNVKIYSNSKVKTPTQFFNLDGIRPERVYEELLKVDVHAPASNFYAIEACDHLGLGYQGAARAGMSPYNTSDEVDRLLNALSDLKA